MKVFEKISAWLGMIPRECFKTERVICRIISSWTAFAYLLVLRGEDYKKLAFAQGTPMATLLAIVAVVFVIMSFAACWLRKYNTDSWFLLIFSTGLAGQYLTDLPLSGEMRIQTMLAVTAVYALVFSWAVKENAGLLSSFTPKKRTVIIMSAVFTVVSFFIITGISVLRYKTFYAPNFDFGLFVNMFYNMKDSGAAITTSERDMLISHFAVHISPVYYLLLPFFMLIPSPVTLLVGQTVVLMLAVVPLVLLAKHFGLTSKQTLAVAFLYVFFAPISTGCFYDLHENCFLPLFLLLTFYFFEKDKPIFMYLSAALVLSIKEDAAIYLAVFAIYAIISRRKYLKGSILFAMSAAWFIFCTWYLETYGLGAMVNRYDNLIYDKSLGLLGAIKTAILNPGFLLTQMFTTKHGDFSKIVYVLEMLLPLGFIPFITQKASRFLLLAPILMNLLTLYVYQHDIGYQYHFGIAAFLFYALVQNMPTLTPRLRRGALCIALSSCFCFYTALLLPKLTSYVEGWQMTKNDCAKIESVLEMIPDDASVNSSTYFIAHIADRREIYEVAYHGNEPDVEYVVLDLRDNWQDYYQAYINHGYEVIANEEGLIMVLQKKN